MNQWLKIGGLVCLGLLLVTCEDATIDYATDIVGDYLVESAVIDGVFTDYSVLPVEEVWIIDITQDNLLSYENEINQCDSNFNVDARPIDSITDTSIIFDDDTRFYYSLEDEKLILSYNGDVITLAENSHTIPPPAWTDPALLTNDAYEPDGSLSQATSISAAGTIQNHYSAFCDDEDYFIFEALEGTSYIIEAEAATTSDIDLTISLYSEIGDSISYSDDQTSSNVDPKLEWTCGASGNYYFVIKKYWDYLDPGNSLDDEKGAYTISVDVTKALFMTPPAKIIKLTRPLRSTHQRHKLFD